jgi:selenocysteine lyase/cysteine desulfurase
MQNRREFLGSLALPVAGAAAATLLPSALARAVARANALPGVGGMSPEEVARDEGFWFELSQAFTVDRSIVNLNNGGVSPSPRIVQDAMKRHLDYSNTATAYTMWQVLEPQREAVRERMANQFGCDVEEVALTRNASESLQICQLGFDLKPGDEVLTTNQDYPRMITTFKQMERRNGIVLKEFAIPTPCEDPSAIVSLFEKNITPKTKLILMCHVINLTGQILPVRDVVRMARAKGIPVLVDGAHALAQFPFAIRDLECDYYAVSLHKWLFAPHGTGLLFVKKDKIAGLWPMMAAPKDMDSNIRKFEEIGTHPAANYLAISEAITFHQGMGPERKAARLRYLRDRWANRLLQSGKVRLHTSLKHEFSCAIGNVEIVDVDAPKLQSWLWTAHRIFTTGITHEDCPGLRITPSVYTTLEEIDRFCAAMEHVISTGLPT